MKTKTKPVSPTRRVRKLARDHAIHSAQAMANYTLIVQFVYEVPALAPLSPFIYIRSGETKPTNGKLILTVRPA